MWPDPGQNIAVVCIEAGQGHINNIPAQAAPAYVYGGKLGACFVAEQQRQTIGCEDGADNAALLCVTGIGADIGRVLLRVEYLFAMHLLQPER